MNAAHSLLHYREDDHLLREVDDLSVYARVSRAFLRLCLENGCPMHGGQLSQAMLLEWLFDHHEQVRMAAGLPPLPSIEGVDADTCARLQMGNAVLTLLEFCESRSSQPHEKRHLRNVQRSIQQMLDRRAA